MVDREARQFRFDDETASDFGFAERCLLVQAITFAELQEWATYVVDQAPDYPTEIFDILDQPDRTDYMSMRSRVRREPRWQCKSGTEENAFDGIAYARFGSNRSDAVGKQKALGALRQAARVETTFRRVFPFIAWAIPPSA